jgi:hypothetical protein
MQAVGITQYPLRSLTPQIEDLTAMPQAKRNGSIGNVEQVDAVVGRMARMRPSESRTIAAAALTGCCGEGKGCA